jgi:hypothetical protein
MSLGLGDLKKKSASSAARKSETNWASQTARPWDASGLVRGPKAKRRSDSIDAVMNDDWADAHMMNFHQIETFNDMKLDQLREAAMKIEQKVKRATSGPLNILKVMIGFVQK